MAKFPSSLVLSTVLDDAPAEEGHGEGSWEVELHSATGVIVPTGEVSPERLVRASVFQARVATPWYIVVLRQLSGCRKFAEQTDQKMVFSWGGSFIPEDAT